MKMSIAHAASLSLLCLAVTSVHAGTDHHVTMSDLPEPQNTTPKIPDIKEPQLLALGQWVKDRDIECDLKYNIDWMQTDQDKYGSRRVIDLTAHNHPTPPDGIYMYTFRADGKIYIRPNDRSTKGINGAIGSEDQRLSYNGEPTKDCPWIENNNKPMYVRHSQLANGNNVYSAGMLQYGNGQLLWISNDSGHYNPNINHVEYTWSVLAKNGETGALNAAICEKQMNSEAGYKPSGRGVSGTTSCPEGLDKVNPQE